MGKSAIAVLFMTFAACTAGNSGAQDALCLRVTTARAEVLLGEPLTLFVELENCSREPQRVPRYLDAERGSLAIRMRAPGSTEERVYRPPALSEAKGAPLLNLMPGEKVATDVPVYFGARGWNLREPGRYAFRAEALSQEGWRLLSDAISVDVKAPASGEQLEPAMQFMTPSVARFLYNAGGDPAAMKELQNIARNHPDTAWEHHAELALAIDDAARSTTSTDSLSCRGLQDATLRVRQFDWAASLRGYAALLRCYSRAGQRESAEQTLRQLHATLPQSRAVRELRVE
jgi:hypothetical protein